MDRHLITGTEQGDNLLQQDDRDDLVYAYGGFDNISTGRGDDLIYAGSDLDYVLAGAGQDEAYGGDGSDVLNGGADNDTLYGDAGSDVLVGDTGQDWLYGGDDDDALYSNNGISGFEDKRLYGGAGNDRLDFTGNDSGLADGGDGHDEVSLTVYDVSGPPWAGVAVTLAAGEGTAQFDSYLLTLAGIEVLRLQTWVGDDSVQSGDGNDVISVHRGANVVHAGAGGDRVTWHTGSANVLEGGSGHDTLELSHTEGQPALIFSAAGGVLSDGYGSTLTGFEKVIIRGWVGHDQAVLGDRADQFFGWQGNDTAHGGLGKDALRGQLGEDALYGEGGDDLLNGGHGDDVLDGGSGNDNLFGSLGHDTLTGGAGADRFRFAAPGETFDHITDFMTGTDKLVFARTNLGLEFGASPLDPGFLAYGGPDAARGQFVVYDDLSGTGSELRWDADGTGISGGVTVAFLDGVTDLTGADFVLLG